MNDFETIIPLHLARGIVVFSLFKWISLTLDDNKSHSFSFQLAKQHDEKILKHIRHYVISKIEIPDKNIPLFVHTVGLLDAFQIFKCFDGLKQYYSRNKQIYENFRLKVLRDYFHKLSTYSKKNRLLKERFQLIQTYSRFKVLKDSFRDWNEFFHIIYLWNHFIYPKILKKHFYRFLSHLRDSSFQRQVLVQVQLLRSSSLLRSCWLVWVNRLCKIANIQKLMTSQILTNWMLSWTRCRMKERGCYVDPQSESSKHLKNVNSLKKVLEVIKLNESSVLCQNFTKLIGDLYLKISTLLNGLLRWKRRFLSSRYFRLRMKRIPRYHSPSSPPHTALVTLYGRRVRALSWEEREKCRRGLDRWLLNTLRRSSLRRKFIATSLTNKQNLLRCSFGSWVILASRVHMLHVAQHRVYNTRKAKLLKLTFSIWHDQFQRSWLHKSHQRQLMMLRDREVEMFSSLIREKREYRYKVSVWTQWIQYVHYRRLGKVLFLIRMKYENEYCKRKLSIYWGHWKTVSSEETIVTCMKALWKGFRCRFLDRYTSWKYQYLLWYRRQVPKILYLRKKYSKRRIFSILWMYLCQQKGQQVQLLDEFKRRSVVRKLWTIIQRKKKIAKCLSIHEKRKKFACFKKCIMLWKRAVITAKSIRVEAANDVHLIYRSFFSRLKLLRKQREAKSFAMESRNNFLKRKYLLKYWLPLTMKHSQTFRNYKALIRMRKTNYWSIWKRAFRSHVMAKLHHNRYVALVGYRKFQLWCERELIKRKQIKGERHWMAVQKAVYWRQWKLVVWRKLIRAQRWVTVFKRLFPGEKKVRTASLQVQDVHEGSFRSFSSKMPGYVRSARDRRNTSNLPLDSESRISLGLQLRYSLLRWKKFISRRFTARKKRDKARSYQLNLNLQLCRHYLSAWLISSVKNRFRNQKVRKCALLHTKKEALAALQKLRAYYKLKKKLRVILYKKYPTEYYRKYFRNKCSRVFVKLRQRIQKKKAKLRELHSRNPTKMTGKLIPIKAIRKLRIKMVHFLEALKLLVYYRKHPQKKYQRKVILNKELQAFKFQFLRWRRFVQRRKIKTMINFYTIVQFQNQLRIKVLRKWFRWTKFRKAFHAIKKRFYVAPIFRSWLHCTTNNFLNRRIINTVQSRISRRTKEQYFVLWKIFAKGSKRMSRNFLMVQRVHLLRVKQHYLNWWMIQLDGKILENKFDQVQKLHRKRLMIKLFRSWHKLSLVNDIITWKNAKKAFQYWKKSSSSWHTQHLRNYAGNRFYKRKMLRMFFQKVKISIHNKGWNHDNQSHSFFRAASTTAAPPARSSSSTLSNSRNRNVGNIVGPDEWKMSAYGNRSKFHVNQLMFTHGQTRNRGFPELPVLREEVEDVLYVHGRRVLRIWLRFSQARQSYRKRLLLRKVFRNWKQHSFTAKFTKQAFVHRMELFFQRFYLAKGFQLFCILYHRRKLSQEITRRRAKYIVERTYEKWALLSSGRLTARRGVESLIKLLYNRLKPQFFLIWKVKTFCGLRLGQSILTQRALQRWKNLYVATRYDRMLSMMRVFQAWSDLLVAKRNNIMLFRNRRTCAFDLLSRSRQILFLKLRSTLTDWKSLAEEGQKENAHPETNRI